MENFVVSARKYRPATFKSVVGQESITNTLKNSIKNNHLAHAYLFCGPRGVGKTTCARIFAKTINCFNRTDDYEACNECESCSAFNNSGSFNIHELDAASNNTVDDIRSLIDQVRIPPQIGKYSVYIIDEVHMLSQAAFNAFLKTLEEPPEHAIFILATTEKHKIIPTILSRCQVFDFNRIKIDDIVNHLEYIAKSEGINYEVEALNVIAQKADGGMRDALSVFDQISSFTENNITYDKVIETLNVLDYDYYFRLTDAFIYNDVSQALLIFDEILSKGFDAGFFINGLSSHLRDLLVSQDEITIQLLEAVQKVKDNYKTFAQKLSTGFIYKALDITNECDLNYRASKNKRLHVELALIKLCNITNADTSDEKKKSELNVQPAKTNQTQQQTTSQKVVAKKSPAAQSQQAKQAPSGSINASISIKNALAGKKEESKNEENKTSLKRNNNFNEQDLLNSFEKYKNEIKNADPHLFSILDKNKTSIDDKTLKIEALSSTQENTLNGIKSDIAAFLRNELENDHIQIEVVKTQIEQKQEKRFLSDKDKYKHLNSINNNLDLLRQEFQLDFE